MPQVEHVVGDLYDLITGTHTCCALRSTEPLLLLGMLSPLLDMTLEHYDGRPRVSIAGPRYKFVRVRKNLPSGYVRVSIAGRRYKFVSSDLLASDERSSSCVLVSNRRATHFFLLVRG